MFLTVHDMRVEVRAAAPADVPLLLGFIRDMAAYEKLTASVTGEDLHESLFAEPPAAHALLVFADGAPAGYVTYFFSFSSMRGRRALWLEDLFIAPDFRGKGLGQALMAYLARLALQHRCVRFEWIVLDWNTPAIEFYKRLGAQILAEWRICRLDEAQLPGVASRLAISPGAAE